MLRTILKIVECLLVDPSLKGNEKHWNVEASSCFDVQDSDLQLLGPTFSQVWSRDQG